MNFASRLSRNAAMPSTRSGDEVASAWKCASSSSELGRSVSNDALRSRFEKPSERVGPAASRRATASASGMQRLGVVDAPVREPEVDGLGAGRAFAEHDHRLGAGQADQAGEEVRAARVGDESPLRERPDEPGARVHEHEVAHEREVRARSDRGAVHGRDRRLVELPELADERLHADAQRLGGGARVESRLARLRDRRRREIHARAERVALAGDEHGAHLRIGAELAYGLDDAVAHADRQRVLRFGTVEDDAADTVDVALDPEVGLRHDASFRLVRMLTTATPEPRPPALCWSA